MRTIRGLALAVAALVVAVGAGAAQPEKPPHGQGKYLIVLWDAGTPIPGRPEVEGDQYLDYMHARYYDPNLGRFLSVDPVLDVERALTEPQRWNRYTYVENNPMNRIDRDGRQSAGFVVYSIAKSDQAAYERGEITREELLLRSEADSRELN